MIMKCKKKIGLGVLAAVMAAMPLRAGIVYQCDFEDATENAQWVLNAGKAGPTLPSIWYIGEPGNFSQTGQNGLFISSDGGKTAVYTANAAEGCVAYRAMTLTPGSYDLDFDWRCMGTTNTNIIVAWVSQSTTTNSAPATLTTNVTNNQIGDKLYGSRGWRSSHITFTVTAANSAGKLVFAWSGAKDTPKPPSGCVDNIIIKETPVVACTKPKNVKYDKQTAYLSWTGPNDVVYQVRDYCSNDGSLIEYDSVADTRLRLMLNAEGTHTFSVRADCGDGNYSEWVSTSTFVWIPGLRCIEYLDIDGVPKGHAGICYTGVYTDYRDNNRPGQIGMVDLGSDNNNSLHTIHTNLDETDFNTDGLLNVVPDGEIASVRLGGREYPGPESRSASIEYQYYVQRGMSDLLDLKFAVVMQDGSHGEGNPSFRLDILDGRGQPLESSCTHYNFIVGFGEDTSGELWHQGIADSDVSWSDWQKVTVSLRPYVGQTLTIRLTAVRCNVDTHFSYAYFTLGCRSGDIEGLSCGDTRTDHFDAPEGFSYRWYKEEDPTRATLGTGQSYGIEPTDTCVYMVECHSLVDYSCYYTLTANPNPRYPEAIGDTVVTHENCQNLVTFSNNSVVRVMNRVTGMTMSIDEPIYTVFFDYGDGKQESVKSTSIKHEYPAEGGHFDAYMIASMNDGECEDTIFYSFDLPDILHTGSTTIEHLCRGEKFQLPDGEWVEDDTLYISYTPNKYGCEAPNELYVYFHDSVAAVTDTTFCEGGYIDFEGSRYTETGTYRVNLLTQYGCDSSLTLNLTVLPRLLLDVPDTVVACGDFGNGEQIIIPHEVLKGRYNGVEVFIDNARNVSHPFDSVYSFGPEDEIAIPVPDSVRPDYYSVLLNPGTEDCPADSVPITLLVKYSSQIMTQKYGFVALLNPSHNYGEFAYRPYEYTWYRNDSVMEGEYMSYIHVTDEDWGARFHVEVVRVDDGLKLASCPLTYMAERPVFGTNPSPVCVRPTWVGKGEPMTITGAQTATLVDILGRTIETFRLGVDDVRTIQFNAPNQKGIYFVKVADHEAIKIMVR